MGLCGSAVADQDRSNPGSPSDRTCSTCPITFVEVSRDYSPRSNSTRSQSTNRLQPKVYGTKKWLGTKSDYEMRNIWFPPHNAETKCGEQDIWSNGKLERDGFLHVPMYHEYYDNDKISRRLGKTFLDYWRYLHDCNIPGFSNPDVKGTSGKPGTFTPTCIRDTFAEYGCIMIDGMIQLYLRWNCSRDVTVYNAYIKWQEETRENFESYADRIKIEYWGTYFKKETQPSGKHKAVASDTINSAPRYYVCPNIFPKQIDSDRLIPIIVWELDLDGTGLFTGLENVKMQILKKEILVDEIDDPQNAKIWCWKNEDQSIPDRHLQHYHFVFDTSDGGDTAKDAQSPDCVSRAVSVGSLTPSGENEIPTASAEARGATPTAMTQANEIRRRRLRQIVGA